VTSASLDLNDPQQPSQQVAASLRTAIASGALPVGERLRSVRELAQQYGVSTGTVQQALRVLRTEGLVTTWQGRGTFVRAQKEGPLADSSDPDAAGEIIQRLDEFADRLERLERQVADLETEREKPQRSKRSPGR
jgi:DNA-binding GntR family transcriptional regulator